MSYTDLRWSIGSLALACAASSIVACQEEQKAKPKAKRPKKADSDGDGQNVPREPQAAGPIAPLPCSAIKDRTGATLDDLKFQTISNDNLPAILGLSFVRPILQASQWKLVSVFNDHRSYSKHEGIDVGIVYQDVLAAANGRVAYVLSRCPDPKTSGGRNDKMCGNGWGNHIVLQHTENKTGANVYTRYAHLSQVAVSLGQVVTKGLKIGVSGNNGISTAPHLHFELGTFEGTFEACAPSNFHAVYNPQHIPGF